MLRTKLTQYIGRAPPNDSFMGWGRGRVTISKIKKKRKTSATPYSTFSISQSKRWKSKSAPQAKGKGGEESPF